MYDDFAYLEEKNKLQQILKEEPNNSIYRKSFLNNIKPFSFYTAIEKNLQDAKQLTFDFVFHEPLGCYMIKSFMASNFSLCKAVFLRDVELYRNLQAPSGRRKTASLIFERFVAPEKDKQFNESVFMRLQNFYNKFEKSGGATIEEESEFPKAFHVGKDNCIGFYKKSVIQEVLDKMKNEQCDPDLFDDIYRKIFHDLQFDIFPRFLKSVYYYRYIRMKSVELETVSIRDFLQQGTLGYGAYGFVMAATKKNTGKVYAIKCLSKKHVIASDHTRSVLDEKTHLSKMASPFVTCLKYSFTDKMFIYIALDLMPCGDLKQQLIKQRSFSEDLSRFYAAEILLGLQHIHGKGIIYRDIKLENILLGENGHVKISDLGLSVFKNKTKGYAGTPGYTAPEVIKGEFYDKRSDYFSFGVIIYRFIAGRKPFGERTGDLNNNTLTIEPKYPKKFFSPKATELIKALLIKSPDSRLGSGPTGIEEIKNHEWFSPIDFGLLEAGYLTPPWKPKQMSLNQDRMTVDQKIRGKRYKKIKITSEFNKKFEEFDFVSTSAVQSEVVEVLQALDAIEYTSKNNVHDMEKGSPSMQCCSIL